MSIRYVATVLDRLLGLSATETLVMVAIADFASDDTRSAWPSVATIARRARCDRRTVQRKLRALERGGLLEIARGGHQYGKGSASSYRLLFDHDGSPIHEPAPPLSTRAAERRGGAAERRPKGGNGSHQGRHGAAPSVIGSVIDPKTAKSREQKTKTGPRTAADAFAEHHAARLAAGRSSTSEQPS